MQKKISQGEMPLWGRTVIEPGCAQSDGGVQAGQYHRVFIQGARKAVGFISLFLLYKDFSIYSVHTPLDLLLGPVADAVSLGARWEMRSAFRAVGWTGASRPSAETYLAHASKHNQPFNSQTWFLA